MTTDAKKKTKKGTEVLIAKVHNDPDFIYAPKYNFSLKRFLERHPHGTSNFADIAKMLLLTEEQVKALYNSAIKKLKKLNHEFNDEG